MSGDGAINGAAAGLSARSQGVSGVDPASGLASDYLNHLYEPLLILEHLDSDPDLLDDLAEWQPRSYMRHFDRSGRSDRDVVLDSYRGAHPGIRTQFDALAREAGEALATALPNLLDKARGGDDVAQHAAVLAGMLRRYIQALDSIIHGRDQA